MRARAPTWIMPAMEQPSRSSTDRWPGPAGPPSPLPPVLSAPPAPKRRRALRLVLVVVTVAGLGAAAVVATDGREERDVDWDAPRAAPSMLATDGEVVCTLGDADDA